MEDQSELDWADRLNQESLSYTVVLKGGTKDLPLVQRRLAGLGVEFEVRHERFYRFQHEYAGILCKGTLTYSNNPKYPDEYTFSIITSSPPEYWVVGWLRDLVPDTWDRFVFHLKLAAIRQSKNPRRRGMAAYTWDPSRKNEFPNEETWLSKLSALEAMVN